MESVDSEVYGGALSGLHDLVVELLLHLCHDLLDTCRVDTSVRHELVQRQAAELASYRVEGGDDDRLRRVVNHDLHTAGSLERADVSSLTADDAALHLVIVDVEDGDGVLYRGLGSHTLYCLKHDLLSLLVGVELGLVHYLVDVALRLCLGLVLERLHEARLGLFGAQAGELLELLALLYLHLLELLLLDGKELLLILYALLRLVVLLLLAGYLLLALVQGHLPLLCAVLGLLDLLSALLHLLLELRLLVEELLLHLKKLLLLHRIGLFLGLCQSLIVYSLDYVAEYEIACEHAYDKGGHTYYNMYHIFLKILVKRFLSISFHRLFDFRGQLRKNVVHWSHILARRLLLVTQGNVNHRHVLYLLLALHTPEV